MKVYHSECIVYHPDCIKNLIGEVKTIQEINDIITGIKITPYTRWMPAINEEGAEDLNGIMVDYGSYSDFIYIDGITFNEYRKERKNET